MEQFDNRKNTRKRFGKKKFKSFQNKSSKKQLIF